MGKQADPAQVVDSAFTAMIAALLQSLAGDGASRAAAHRSRLQQPGAGLFLTTAPDGSTAFISSMQAAGTEPAPAQMSQTTTPQTTLATTLSQGLGGTPSAQGADGQTAEARVGLLPELSAQAESAVGDGTGASPADMELTQMMATTAEASTETSTDAPAPSGGEDSAGDAVSPRLSAPRAEAANSTAVSAATTASEAMRSGAASAIGISPANVPLPDRIAGDNQAADSISPFQQVADRVQVSLERGEPRATLQLNPPELGKVHIQLNVENGQLHLSIRAEQVSTQRLLDQQMGELRQSLEGRGLKVGDLTLLGHQRTEAGAGESVRAEVFHHMRTSMSGSNADMGQESFQQRQSPSTANGFGEQGQHGNQPAYRQEARQPFTAARPSDARAEEDASGPTVGTAGMPSGPHRLQGFDTYA